MAEGEKEPADWNDPYLQSTFSDALLRWKTDKHWNSSSRTRLNWQQITDYVNQVCSVNLQWEQYASKYYRWKDGWSAFKALRGRCRTCETGLEWDEEKVCFTAAAHQWKALC